MTQASWWSHKRRPVHFVGVLCVGGPEGVQSLLVLEAVG